MSIPCKWPACFCILWIRLCFWKISVISSGGGEFYWLRKQEVAVENHRPTAGYWQTLSHDVVSSTHHHERGSNSQLQWWCTFDGSRLCFWRVSRLSRIHYPLHFKDNLQQLLLNNNMLGVVVRYIYKVH